MIRLASVSKPPATRGKQNEQLCALLHTAPGDREIQEAQLQVHTNPPIIGGMLRRTLSLTLHD